MLNMKKSLLALSIGTSLALTGCGGGGGGGSSSGSTSSTDTTSGSSVSTSAPTTTTATTPTSSTSTATTSTGTTNSSTTTPTSSTTTPPPTGTSGTTTTQSASTTPPATTSTTPTSSSSTTTATAPAPVQPAACGTVQTGTTTAAAIDALNSYRTIAGLPTLGTDQLLQQAAANHTDYLTYLATADRSHTEVSSNNCFTGTDITARLTAAGASTAGNLGEVFNQEFFNDGRADIDQLMTTVYHRIAMLLNFNKVGAAWAQSPNNPPYIMTMEFNGSQTSYPTGVVTYPAANQNDVPIDWALNEVPCPLGCSNTGALVGYPITIQIDGKALSLSSFKLTDSSGAAVAGSTLSSANDGNMPNNAAAFIPQHALTAGATYTASVTGSTVAGAFSKTWSFTTHANSAMKVSANVTSVANGQTVTINFSGGTQNYTVNGSPALTWSAKGSQTTSYVQTSPSSFVFTNTGGCKLLPSCNVTFYGQDTAGQMANTTVAFMP